MKRNIFKTALAVAICAVMTLTGCSSSNADSSADNGEPADTEETDEGDEELTEEEKAYMAYMEKLSTQGDKITQLDPPSDGEEIAVIHTSMGDIKVRFFPDEAPLAVENFKTLAKDGYYDGIIFHRVINDFMIQGGDPTGTGTGGESSYGGAFADEFSPNLYNFRGALSMANSGMNTNGSQFFIVQKPEVQEGYWEYIDGIVDEYGADNVLFNNQTQKYVKVNYSDEARELYNVNGGTPHLDYAHTVFGQVFEGMDVVDAIASVATDENDKPADDVIINSITFENYKA